MNLSAKPISSPGRPDKYPPPLMRFLKSNAASKSRGKSRSSPMFIRNKKNNIVQEPTSPKVTCIGQVRSKARTGRTKPGLNQPCSCFRIKRPKPLFFCPNFGKKLRPRWLKPDWSKWVLFFRSGYCRKSKILADSAKSEAGEDEEIEAENVELSEDLRSTCPPKNALLLTRCRSAPYRSSSQISRFCPISETGEEKEKKEKTEDFGDERENGETEKPTSKTGDLGPIEKKLVDLRLIEEIISRKSEEVARIKVQPLVLLRCKSEPAKTGERLIPPEEGMREKGLVMAEAKLENEEGSIEDLTGARSAATDRPELELQRHLNRSLGRRRGDLQRRRRCLKVMTW